jgi:tetraacyldisaccharide 4'-kinase
LVSSTKKILLTTEKDAVKLFEPTVQQWLKGYQIFVLPVRVEFFNEQEFNDLILNYVKQS